MKDESIYNLLFNEISKMPVIDTHEHLLWDEDLRVKDNGDILTEYLSHYLSSDVISAGLKKGDLEKVLDKNKSITERWNIVEPFWEYSRYTGYGRALDISVKAIYGIDGVNRNTIEALNETFMINKKPGHYKRVLKDLCNIEISLLDIWAFRLEGKNDLFKRIWQPTVFIKPFEDYDMLSEIEKNHNITVSCLDDWIEALDRELEYILTLYETRVLKCAIAYMRTLKFEKTEYSLAKELFTDALNKRNNKGITFDPKLQDFMMHYVLKRANEKNLTIQFHTGLLEGNGNMLPNSDPSLLTNLFMEYTDVDFDIFHIGYPYQNVVSALCKMFPNVYIDMCWAHIISPSASINALNDFLDAIPYNKISAFGGDYLFPDGIYGHLHISRENITHVLVQRIKSGLFDEGKALEIAKSLYYDNPKRIFKLD